MLFLIAVLVLAASCAANQEELRKKELHEMKGGAGALANVPFFPQDGYRCGPAALASVLKYYGIPTTMEEVAGAVYDESLKGTLPIDMVIYAKDKNFDNAYYRGGFDDLKRRVDEKNPPILFLNLGYNLYPIGHYVVVTGYDDEKRTVTAHSNMERDKVFTYEELDKAWEMNDYATILITPKDDK